MDAVVAKPIDFEFLITTMENLVPENIGTPSAPQEAEEPDNSWTGLAFMEGIDSQRAKGTWRKAKVYAEALHHFSERHAHTAADAVRLVEEGAFDDARQACHALKGTADNLFITSVARAAAAAEALCREQLREEALAGLEELSSSLALALADIAGLKGSMGDTGIRQQTEPFSPDAVIPLFRELMTGIDLFDPYAVGPVLNQLSAQLPPGAVQGISARVRTFDFDGAKQEAHILAGRLGLDLEG